MSVRRLRQRHKPRTRCGKRLCYVSREVYDRTNLIRLCLRKEEGLIIWDIEEKLGGRGLWLFPTPEHLAQFSRKNKCFLFKIFPPIGLISSTLSPAFVGGALKTEICRHLGLLRRAGGLAFESDVASGGEELRSPWFYIGGPPFEGSPKEALFFHGLEAAFRIEEPLFAREIRKALGRPQGGGVFCFVNKRSKKLFHHLQCLHLLGEISQSF